MKLFSAILLLACLSLPSFADDANMFVGIWAAGGVKKTGPALFLFPDGRAYFHAMCGSAPGSWKMAKSPGTIEVTLREDTESPEDHITLQLDKKGWLIRQKTESVQAARKESIASEALQELEKTEHKLQKTE
jgi:hypothetical protein